MEHKWQKEQAKTTRYAKERSKVRMRISETWKGACGIDRLTEIQRNINRSRAKKARVELGEKKEQIEKSEKRIKSIRQKGRQAKVREQARWRVRGKGQA